jgi:hypothetical protein
MQLTVMDVAINPDDGGCVMPYQAKENDILSTVRDVETMCEYIHTNKPLLTQKGDLSTKACFELNGLMTHPKADAKRTDRMGHYQTVSLYFSSASSCGLIEPCKAGGGKSAISTSEAYATFQKMSNSTKYLLIFLSWMHDTDIEELYARDPYIVPFGAYIMDRVMEEIGRQNRFEWIAREEDHDFFSHFKYPLQSLMNCYFGLLCHLRDFGILTFDDRDVDTKDPYHITVRKMMITEFGAALCAACDSRRFSWVNSLEDSTLHLGDDGDGEIELFEKIF